MNKTMTYMLMLAMTALPAALRADDMSTGDTVKHPVQAYHEHEAKADSADAQTYSQQKAEAKARMDQAKKDYESSLQTNGADNSVTKDAKKRFADARKEYQKYAKKTAKAGAEAAEDMQKVNQDKAAH